MKKIVTHNKIPSKQLRLRSDTIRVLSIAQDYLGLVHGGVTTSGCDITCGSHSEECFPL